MYQVTVLMEDIIVRNAFHVLNAAIRTQGSRFLIEVQNIKMSKERHRTSCDR